MKYKNLTTNTSNKFNGEQNETGLVLEGGAMRGMYTAGALDVLLEMI